MKKFFLFFILFSLFFLRPPSVKADESTCFVYFTGVGCPHCAKVEPILEDLMAKRPELKIIEYEIYQNKENAPLLTQYNKIYGSGLGIPLIIFGKDDFFAGEGLILKNLETRLESIKGNPCPLIDGTGVAYEDLEVANLPGKAKVLPEIKENQIPGEIQPSELTLAKVVSLAAVDAVNPCALAVLTMILFAILAFAPQKRHNVLLAGLVFTCAVFIMYFFYGLIIIRFFQLIKALTSVRLWLYKFLGLVAIILGFFNLRDFVQYKPGGFLTEMPLFLRPKVQNLMFKATSPRGAFVIGILVTLFLLPCTIGPYVICGGILCTLDLMATVPWLLFYNLIFVLPMLAITLACFIGFTTVENVAGWKDKNIRYLHLVAGLIILGLGLTMFLGWL
jgi:thiol-disulfide isomerase/thioredoxin